MVMEKLTFSGSGHLAKYCADSSSECSDSILLSLSAALYMFVRYCSPFLPMFLRCLMLMLSGPVELLFLLFLIAARTCSVVMFICVGFRLSTFLVIFLFVVLVL